MSQSSPAQPKTAPPPDPPPPGRTPVAAVFGRQVGISAGLAAVVVAMLLAFGLSGIHAGPHHLRVGVAGPTAATARISAALNGADPKAYDITSYPDEAAMASAVKNRDIYGGFVPAPGALRVLVAPAAGGTVATSLGTLGYAMGDAAGLKVAVVDVVPFPADDQRGAGLTATALPIVIGGILPALIFIRAFPGSLRRRALAVLVYSVVGGFAVGAVLDFWFGTVDANYPLVSLGLALGMAAIALPFLGMDAIFGALGFAVMIGLIMILGNALSGLASGPDWLPAGWGTVGQLLPPGASGSLLRSVAYFNGKGFAGPLITLAVWVLIGYVLSAAGIVRERRQGHQTTVLP